MTLLMEFGLNVLVACLLGATIFYCWLLNKRIQVLQDSRSELAELLLHFDQSTQKASESVKALQVASRKITDTIHERIQKANQISDDLGFLVERANSLADQMEAGIAIARQKEKLSRQPEQVIAKPIVRPVPQMESTEDEEPRLPTSIADEVISDEDKAVLTEAVSALKKRSAASLQSLLQKVAERTSDPVLRGHPTFSQNGHYRARSEHEAELIEALKTGAKV